jgi:hypothetical protein
MTARAIETRYNGNKYRSRLEARWAVFMDNLGIEYRYEYEGYDLDGLWYLPDFWLPALEMWIEVKPGDPSPGDLEKIRRLTMASSESPVVLFMDVPGQHQISVFSVFDFNDERGPFVHRTDRKFWNDCTLCGAVWLESDECREEPCDCIKKRYLDPIPPSPRVTAAFQTARQFRF